ncbi:MAG: DMT family transporter [Ignavibacteriae bacterium]|jgi:drug/metabolite transporter (DMT)-like permease|nr:DMT family transporter [Ignavibacteriota bacterium]
MSINRQMKKLSMIVFLIFTAAFTPIAAKFTVAEISPISLAFLRFGIAAVLLSALFLYKKLSFKIEKKDYRIFIILGALVIPVNQLFFLNGVNLSYASHSGVIYSCTPLFAYLLSIKIKHEHFSVHRLFPIILSIAGIVVIFYESIIKTSADKSTVLWGDLLLVGAVASWAAYITLSRDMVHKYGALKSSTISFAIGLLMYVPFFLYDLPNLTFSRLTMSGIIGFVHLSVIVAFAGYFVFTYATKYISVTTLTTSTNISPVITILFSWVLLKEELSYFFIAGAVITFTGVFLSQIKNGVFQYTLSNNGNSKVQF